MAWLEEALCGRAADAEVFFGGTDEAASRALWYCRRCPVRDACLEFALANDHRYGTWGGITSRRRWRLHDARDALEQVDGDGARR
jgi:WhiB family redox-sensing transcriptional regulator